jgi:hypothetical protein
MTVHVSDAPLAAAFIVCCVWLFRVPFRFEAKRDGVSDPGDDFYKDMNHYYTVIKSRYNFSVGIFPIGKIVTFYIIFYIILSILRLVIGLSEGR